jgi:branched-chain amino acid transport system ATP-binding protein
MANESLAIVGRNGMGKTTVCAAVMGLTPPRCSGSVRFEGQELLGKPSYKISRAGIGYVPQGRRLFPSLTVDEHLKIAARNGGGGSWTKDRVYELFPRLKERSGQLAGTLSGGEQQMLAIGRAMMARPKVLMLDEPSLGLAPILVETIFQVLSEINSQGTPILLVEQNAHKALEVAHRGYVLETGSIVKEGKGMELLQSEDVQKAYLGM